MIEIDVTLIVEFQAAAKVLNNLHELVLLSGMATYKI